MDDQLAAVRAAQAQRFAASRDAEPINTGSSKRKASVPKKHNRGAAAGSDTAAKVAGHAVAAAVAPLIARASAPKPVVPTKHARVNTLSVEELTLAYYTAGGGGTDVQQRVQSQSDVENRVRAAEEGKCSFEEKAGRLTVTYRAVRHDIEERVQALSRETTLDVLVAIMRRATTQRRSAGSAGFHLIQPREQASRSHTVFWNGVRHFGSAQAAASAAKDIISAPPPQEQ
jgi:hypothetical protein